LALAFLEAGKTADARVAINKARGQPDTVPLLMRISAAVERAGGKDQEAATLLRRATALYPEDRGILIAHARLLLDQKLHREAAELVSAFLRRHESPEAYALLAEAETSLGHSAAAHFALAEKYYRMDEITLAIEQLRIARQDPKADFYTLSRIEARLVEFERLLPAAKSASSP
jgi:predicted Zn-dependent protease